MFCTSPRTGTSTLRNISAPRRASASATGCGVDTITTPAHTATHQRYQRLSSAQLRTATQPHTTVTNDSPQHSYVQPHTTVTTTLLSTATYSHTATHHRYNDSSAQLRTATQPHTTVITTLLSTATYNHTATHHRYNDSSAQLRTATQPHTTVTTTLLSTATYSHTSAHHRYNDSPQHSYVQPHIRTPPLQRLSSTQLHTANLTYSRL